MIKKAISFVIGCIITVAGFHSPVFSETSVRAAKITTSPVINGLGDDDAWEKASEVITFDRVGNMDIHIKAVYTDSDIFFLIKFSDRDESRLHKPWIWNKADEQYDIGYLREDCFVFKWAISRGTIDLSVHSDIPHIADIWFWKANRTDPAGFADDKIQRLLDSKRPKSMKVTSRSGKPMFLLRKGDRGKPAYRSVMRLDYEGDMIPQFETIQPSESRSDIRAKGTWSDNLWTIEFARSLKTGQDDDVQFDTSKKYHFGVSRYEIAGRNPDPRTSQPLYGAGDVSELLILLFEE